MVTTPWTHSSPSCGGRRPDGSGATTADLTAFLIGEADRGISAAIRKAQVSALVRSLDLMHRHADLGARDAVHAATALTAGLDRVVSTDRVFDRIDQLRRVDPADADAPWAVSG